MKTLLLLALLCPLSSSYAGTPQCYGACASANDPMACIASCDGGPSYSLQQDRAPAPEPPARVKRLDVDCFNRCLDRVGGNGMMCRSRCEY